MKGWILCIALSLIGSSAMAQQQAGPPPDYQDQQGNGPPPGYQGQDDGPPPGYQDNGPPPGYQDPRDSGPPPGYDDRQGNAPPPGYQGGRDNMPPDADGAYGRADDRGAQGAGSARADERRTTEGLGGWILVTSDENWQTKWETASSTRPTFTAVRDLNRGKKAFVLIFLANPQLDRAGQANVTCDIELTRPDGSVSTRQSDSVCFSGKPDGDAQDTYLSAPVIGFVGDPRDPAGTWRIKVTLKDNNRHTSLPLQASFNLKK